MYVPPRRDISAIHDACTTRTEYDVIQAEALFANTLPGICYSKGKEHTTCLHLYMCCYKMDTTFEHRAIIFTTHLYTL